MRALAPVFPLAQSSREHLSLSSVQTLVLRPPPEANLYNGAGLPAVPFRSDAW